MAAPTTPSASLYVGDLSKDPKVVEPLLHEIFSLMGPISSIKLCRDVQTRRSLGYAYVNFHRPADAERALKEKNFTKILGKPCRIMWCQRDPKLRKSNKGNIFIKNLPKGFDHEALHKMFSPYGKILSSKIPQTDKGEFLNYGFVHYAEEKSALAAIAKEDNRVIDDTKINVMKFVPKSERGGAAAVTNVYVKNIPTTDFTEKELEELFGAFGKITSSKVPIDQKANDGSNKGHAYVNFEKSEQAQEAIKKLHESTFKGKELYVQPHQSAAMRREMLKKRHEKNKANNASRFAGTNLFIKNLGDNVDDKKLLELFSTFGTIQSGKIMLDDAKKSKGFGFVNYESPEDATKAVTEMNGKIVDGKPLYVALAQSKAERWERIQASFNARNMKAAQMQMYHGGQGQMFYANVPQQNRVMYNQQMMQQQPRRFYNQQPMVRPVYNNMVMNNGRGGGRGRGRGRGGNRKNQQGYKFNGNARNQPMQAGPQGAVMQTNGQMVQQAPQVINQQMPAPDLKAELEQADPEKQKRILGERIYPEVVAKVGEQQAGKITGMLLEMELDDLLPLVNSPNALSEKVQEAREVLLKAGSQTE